MKKKKKMDEKKSIQKNKNQNVYPSYQFQIIVEKKHMKR